MSPVVVAGIAALVVVVIVFVVAMRRGGASSPPPVVDEAVAALKLPLSSTKVGRFTVRGLVCPGKYANVYAATADDGSEVSVKLPTRASLGDADELKRFERESQMLATIQHPNIVRKLEDGRVDERGRKVPFMVLEPMAGLEFGAFLAERAPLPVGEAVAILEQIASALEAVHGQGIVHRNLGPEALRVTPEGRVLVHNFGVARAETMQTITLHGQVVGSVEFIAPEQISGARVDARSDLYALGVLAYQLLTGKSPFVYSNISGLVKQKSGKEGPHPQKLVDQVPAELDRLVSQLMSADPNRRPASAERVRRDLESMR